MRLARVAAGALVGVAVLAGCSAKEPANDTLPTPSSTSAEASETLAPLGPPDLPMPDRAREQTAAGAIDFLGYYIDVMNDAQIGLNSTFLRALSVDCATCDAFIEGVDGYAEEGYRLTGGQIVLASASEPAIGSSGAEFSISLTQQPLTATGPDGTTVDSSPEASYPASGALVTWDRTRTTWLMSELTIQ